MFTGIYSAATAMDVAERRHEVASRNLAYAHLPGYSKEVLDQRAYRPSFNQTLERGGISRIAGTQAIPRERVDTTPGSIRHTGNTLDLALKGPGYFAVDSDGETLYTRSGGFRLNSSGEIITVDGLNVRSRSGNLVVPAGTSIEDLQVTAEGRIFSGAVELGQLELVEIQPLAPLQRAGASLIRVPDEYVQPASTTAVLQGALESSNVQSIEELVTIMIGSRQYEAAQRIIRSLSEAAQSHIHSQQGG